MNLGKKIGIIVYVIIDFVTAMIAWAGLFAYRKLVLQFANIDEVLADPKLIYGIIIIPMFWVFLYFVTGTYSDIYRKSRLSELFNTFLITSFGVVILFFALMVDDINSNVYYQGYYKSIVVLFSLHFLLTASARMVFLSIAKRQIISGGAGFSTLIIGSNKKAIKLYKELSEKTYLGYRFKGFIYLDPNNTNGLTDFLPELGQLKQLPQIIEDHEIEEIIIALETSEHNQINEVINLLAGQDVIIKIIPGMYDILSGSVKMGNVIGAVLIEIYPDLMPFWQRLLKRNIDIVASIVSLLALSPLLLYLAIRVRLSSKGPIFYTQKRIGIKGKPFNMYKFRSMYTDAEINGPALSSDDDQRITLWGKTMRKWRFDELPQFINVLKGNMSLVGPRPERQYFIDKILAQAPEYKHLQKVKPGITSMGMVKFGYAQNIDEMIQRMKFDLVYIENMGLSMDFKIMIYTVLIVIQGKGK